MPPKFPWLRLWNDILKDRKLEWCSRQTQAPAALVVGVWATLLALANDSPTRGSLMIAGDLWLTAEEIRAHTGLEVPVFSTLMDAFASLGMVAGWKDDRCVIVNFHKRNYPSDSSTKRSQKHRLKNQPALQQRSSNTLEQWLRRIESERNKNAVVQELFLELYTGRKAPDFGYIGKTAKALPGKHGSLAQWLWRNAGDPPSGDIIAYCRQCALSDAKPKPPPRDLEKDIQALRTAMAEHGPIWQPKFSDPFLQRLAGEVNWIHLGTVQSGEFTSRVKTAWFKLRQQ